MLEGLGERCKLSQRGRRNLVHSKAVTKPLVAIAFSILKWMFTKWDLGRLGWRRDRVLLGAYAPAARR